MDTPEMKLLAEQFSHTIDLLNGRITAVETAQGHDTQLTALRLDALERSQADQEARLRAVADAVVRLTTSTSLAQVGQAAFAVILSALAAYLGRR